MNYSCLLTVTGQAKIAAALQPGGTPLTLTHIALGDGGGAAIVPSVHRAELMREVHRQGIDAIATAPDDPTQVRIQASIPPEVGGFVIREIGLYDVDGDFIAWGSFPDTIKPLLTSGAGSELIIRVHLAVASAEAVTILVDPSITNATQTWVHQQLDGLAGESWVGQQLDTLADDLTASLTTHVTDAIATARADVLAQTSTGQRARRHFFNHA